MKCLVLMLCLALLSLIVVADDKPLVVGSEQNYPPFALGMTDEEADGFTVELWKAVAAETRLSSTIRVLPFHDVLHEFKAGNIDVLINLAQSDERRQFADFTVPHVIVHGAIFVRKGNQTIQSEADLKDKKIIVLNADLAHDYAVQQGWQSQLVLVDTAEQGFKLLAAGQYDALLLSKLAGKQTLEKLKLHTIEALPIKVGFAQKFSFAVRKGNAELLAKINEGLALTKVSGVYDTLYEKWFGVYEELAFLPLLIRYLTPIVLFFLCLISIVLYRREIERKQAMLVLQASESRFRDLFENAPLPYQSLDNAGHFLYVNEAWLELVGYSREQVIGQPLEQLVDESSKTEVLAWLAQVSQQQMGSLVLKLNCQTGTRIVLVKWQVARNEQQLFQSTHCILNDLTERFEAEQALRENQTALAALHADLVQFTYVAAHHLQEPSRRAVTFVQRLHNQLIEHDWLDDEINTSLIFIEQSATRQKALVRDIQLYLAATKPVGKIEQVSVLNVLAKVIKHHTQRIRETEAVIDYQALPTVRIDVPRLYDIFNILLDNALRYRNPARKPCIHISAEKKAGRVYFSVADNGMGIPADCRERVFFVFERLHHDDSDSTGIGLSIVRRIVQSCYGTVSLAETPQGGTTVLFDLPE